MYRHRIHVVVVWLLCHAALATCHAQPVADGPAEAWGPRVLVTTDVNNAGGDPDDKQSLAHLLMYADELDIVGIIPERWDGRGVEAAMQVIDAYAQDYGDTSTRYQEQVYPTPGALRRVVQTHPDSARQHLIQQARKASPSDPLYVLVWGKMVTLKNALFEAPSIADNLRVLTIATHLKAPPEGDCREENWNAEGRNAIFEDPRFRDLWWVESNWTYNAMFEGQAPRTMLDRLAPYGALGRYTKQVVVDMVSKRRYLPYPYFRAGDTPTVLYMLDPNHDLDTPSQGSWAGRFTKPFPDARPTYWTGIDGGHAWNYARPCSTWERGEAVYEARMQTLLNRRDEMYAAWLEKLDTLYPRPSR